MRERANNDSWKSDDLKRMEAEREAKREEIRRRMESEKKNECSNSL